MAGFPKLDSRAGFVFVTLGSLLFLSPTLGYFSGFLDEGLVLAPAVRAYLGEVVYRDFYLFTTPGPVYLYAAFMKIFGDGTLSTSACLWLIRAFSLGGMFLVGRAIMPGWYAVVPPLIQLFAYAHEANNYVNHWVANLVLVWALYALLWYLQNRSWKRLSLAGVAIAAAGMTMPTFGVLLVLIGLIATLPKPKPTLILLISIGLGAVPWFATLAFQGALGDFWNDVILFNLRRSGTEYVSVSTFLRICFQNLEESIAYLPTFLVMLVPPLVGSIGPLWVALRNKQSRSFWVVYGASILVFAHCFYRILPSQLLLHNFLSIVTMLWFFSQLNRKQVGPSLAVLSLLTVAPIAWTYLSTQWRSERVWLELPRGKVWVHTQSSAESLIKLRNFFAKELKPGEPLLLLPYVPNLYYVMELEPATRFCQLISLQYSREQMSEAVASLEEKGYPKIIYFPIYESPDFISANWPDQTPAAYYQQRDWFHGLLLQHYKIVDLGAVWVFER